MILRHINLLFWATLCNGILSTSYILSEFGQVTFRTTGSASQLPLLTSIAPV